MIQSITHVSFIVADTGRSLLFYRDVLGLSIDPQRPDLGFPGVWLDLGAEQQVHLLEVPNPDPREGRPEHGGRDRHAAFLVGDLEALATRLTSADVSISRSRSGRAALFCRDPDGNALEFIQMQTPG